MNQKKIDKRLEEVEVRVHSGLGTKVSFKKKKKVFSCDRLQLNGHLFFKGGAPLSVFIILFLAVFFFFTNRQL